MKNELIERYLRAHTEALAIIMEQNSMVLKMLDKTLKVCKQTTENVKE